MKCCGKMNAEKNKNANWRPPNYSCIAYIGWCCASCAELTFMEKLWDVISMCVLVFLHAYSNLSLHFYVFTIYFRIWMIFTFSMFISRHFNALFESFFTAYLFSVFIFLILLTFPHTTSFPCFLSPFHSQSFFRLPPHFHVFSFLSVQILYFMFTFSVSYHFTEFVRFLLLFIICVFTLVNSNEFYAYFTFRFFRTFLV